MYQKVLFIISCLLCGAFTSSWAQETIHRLRPTVEGLQLQRHGEEVRVWFRLRLDSIDLPSNRLIRLTPILTHEDSVCALPSLVVAGHRQHILQQRHDASDRLIRRKNRSRQQTDYAAATPYRSWMNDATLYLTQDFCGCGGQSIAQASIASQAFPAEKAAYEVHPALAFVVPPVEKIKQREESGQAFLDFPVNETVIYPGYRRNTAELAKIEQTIQVIYNDTNTHIRRIRIHGFASPEGNYANNRRLAQGRAEALKAYVSTHYAFADSLFEVTSTPEDWTGLTAYIRQSDLPHREELLQLMETDTEADRKESKLRAMIGQEAYHHLLKEVYPSLRHSDYTVSYTVRAFSLEEAKRLLKSRPQLLSLNEMYQIAATYPPGSEAFNEVFDIAVRLFPDDPIANLNAALAALHEKRTDKAAQYLAKAGDSPAALHACGVLYLLTDQLTEAEPLLKAAEEAGITEATDNLHQLGERRKYLQHASPEKKTKEQTAEKPESKH
ncbi:secreted protein containing Outer membrane protein, OmpA/MotB [gut metagenome]|uniref:Secreted protein containing Outer membrane protein, OmpA/MotB n=1 Tax=gut metagenome TaxID=749906 RepID=J9D2W9_9ZZZZ